MFQPLRKIVAGPKKRLQWNGKQLDLTYVTDRVIAMAFPASGIQQTYRNSIKDVAQYIEQKHGNNYLIVNVSSRKYDYKYFQNKVIDYAWKDHFSPPLTTLFEISREVYQFLKQNKNNVVAVHCNHGKGRTGTTIIAFIMFTGFFEKFDQTLIFYNKRRFLSSNYGVSQPCQKRYLSYFEKLRSIQKMPRKLITYKLKSIHQKGLDNQNYYLEIVYTRTQQLKYKKVPFSDKNSKVTHTFPRIPLIGDICLQIFYSKWTKDEEIATINLNTYFLHDFKNITSLNDADFDQIQKKKKQNTFFSVLTQGSKLKLFDSDSIKVKDKHSKQFSIQIQFQPYCSCHLPQKSTPSCKCQIQRAHEQNKWSQLIQNISVSQKISKLQSCSLLFNVQYLNDQYQMHINNPYNQSKQSLARTFSSSQKRQINQNSLLSQKMSKSSNQNNNQNCKNRKLSSNQNQNCLYQNYQNNEHDKLSNKPRSCENYDQEYFKKLKKNNQRKQSQDFQYDFVVINRNSV